MTTVSQLRYTPSYCEWEEPYFRMMQEQRAWGGPAEIAACAQIIAMQIGVMDDDETQIIFNPEATEIIWLHFDKEREHSRRMEDEVLPTGLEWQVPLRGGAKRARVPKQIIKPKRRANRPASSSCCPLPLQDRPAKTSAATERQERKTNKELERKRNKDIKGVTRWIQRY